ncbi:uncharacterized protein LOC111049340 isoform X2 [Nilaparvata lugens]|uniref:uncharacterized protein LOC111049340 isoform X2 n=1 Tax=Nilaparvata lugens TaxID=108931 RepID=UPI00193DCFC3|nr:uncharacterized protein LOC111049340 isoform X2 [Nilaparvata lugens]
MVATTEKRSPVKMAGYLEKRGKMRMVCRWKRLWFVLKGRLLHYYKSQMDYINLSPCHGSLNMGIAANVHPGKGLELQILTRSQTIILRAVNKQEHEQWLQALVDAMAQQDYIQTHSMKPVQHFRYPSNEVLYSEIKDTKLRTSSDKGSTSTKQMEKYKKRNEDEVDDGSSSAMDDTSSLLSKSTVSNFGSCLLDHCPYRYRSGSKQGSTSRFSDFCTNAKQNIVNKRLEKLTSCRPSVASSDTSIPTSLMKQQKVLHQNTLLSLEDKSQSLKELRLSTNDDNLDSSEIGSKLLKDKDICFSAESRSCLLAESNKRLAPTKDSTNDLSKKLVNRSESMSSLRNKAPMDKKQLQEMKILIEGKTVYGSSDSIYRRTSASEKSRLLKGDILYKRDVEKIIARRLGSGLYENNEIKSDTDLSMRNHTQSYTGSCGHLSAVSERVTVENSVVDFNNKTTASSDNLTGDGVDSEPGSAQNGELTSQPCKSVEDDRIALKLSTPVSKLIKENGSSGSSRERGLERKGTLKKRSLSFLKRMWKWKEEKMEGLKSEKEKMDISGDVEKFEANVTSDDNDSSNETSAIVIENESKDALLPEPPPDYDLHFVPDVSMDEEAPTLPPRSGSFHQRSRPTSPWHDVPTNNQPVLVCSAHENEDKPPPLPVKKRKSTLRSSSSIGSATENVSPHSSTTLSLSVNDAAAKMHSQFDSLEGIADSVFAPEHDNSKQDSGDESPVYDVPRLHGSLILRKESLQDSLMPTHFLNNSNLDLHKAPSHTFEEDSLDVNPALWRTNDLDQNFTPDSLECDQHMWSAASGADAFHMTWTTNIEDSHAQLSKPFLSTRQKSYDDLPIKGQDLASPVELATN